MVETMTTETREITQAKIDVLRAIQRLMALTGEVFKLSDVHDFARPVDPMQPDILGQAFYDALELYED
jgi:hypothetical protein